MHGLNDLQTNILKTLAYYQALSGLALTSVEIQKYLHEKVDGYLYPLFNILEDLEDLLTKGVVTQKDGFWGLPQNTEAADEMLENRIKNSKYTALKWKKFAQTGRFLPYVPFIRSVSVTGSTAINNAKKKSDIDVLLTVRDGAIWGSRFFVTTAALILKRRRYGKNIDDRLCFNQYISKREQVFGPGTIDNTVKNMKINVWNDKKDTSNEALFSFKPSKPLLLIKRAAEGVLSVSGVDHLLERMLGKIQIAKIHSNPTDYPKELEQPQIGSKNLIFYYPKVISTEEKYKNILKTLTI